MEACRELLGLGESQSAAARRREGCSRRDRQALTDGAPPRECRELLGLGESQSARVEVSKYLRVWSSRTGFLRREGTKGPKVRYLPLDTEQEY